MSYQLSVAKESANYALKALSVCLDKPMSVSQMQEELQNAKESIGSVIHRIKMHEEGQP